MLVVISSMPRTKSCGFKFWSSYVLLPVKERRWILESKILKPKQGLFCPTFWILKSSISVWNLIFRKYFLPPPDMDIILLFLPLSPQNPWKHFFCWQNIYLAFMKIIPNISFIFHKFFLVSGSQCTFPSSGSRWKENNGLFRACHFSPSLWPGKDNNLPLCSFSLVPYIDGKVIIYLR